MQTRFQPSRLKWRFLAASGLALAAALGAGLLPGGFLPKIAGPCGRELCNCSVEECCAQHCALQHAGLKQPAGKLTFTAASLNNANAPGVALQVVFSGVLAPKTLHAAAQSSAQLRSNPITKNFALLSFSADIHTPPPRSV